MAKATCPDQADLFPLLNATTRKHRCIVWVAFKEKWEGGLCVEHLTVP